MAGQVPMMPTPAARRHRDWPPWLRLAVRRL